MLKKNLIPTPLVLHKAHRSDLPTPVRWRLLFIIGLTLRSIWYALMIRYRPRSGYTVLALAQMVTARFERLGGLWIKTAQILAMRRDMFSKEFCDELSRLHDRAHGFPGEIARKIIEEDLVASCPGALGTTCSRSSSRPSSTNSIIASRLPQCGACVAC